MFSAFTRAWEYYSIIMRAQIDCNSEGFWHNEYKLDGRPLARAAVGIKSQSQEGNKRFQDGA